MAFSHKISVNWSSGARSITCENDHEGSGQQSVDEIINDSETDKLVAFAVDVSQIVVLYMLSDQEITIETNDGSSPDDTLTLKAGRAYVWIKDYDYNTCKFTTDITKLYVTNSSGSAAHLQIEVETDATP